MRRDTRQPEAATLRGALRASSGTVGATAPLADVPPLPDPARVDPSVLSALLARHGWVRRGGPQGRYSRWAAPDDLDPDTSLLVPADRSFDDSLDLLEEAVAALARSGVPSAGVILAALAVPGDEVHWRREVPGAGGAVSWDADAELHAGASEMLAAAAKAGQARAAYFGARFEAEARDFLERVVVVAPGSGAGTLTAYLPAPDDRASTTALARSLEAMRDAVDLQRTTGRADAFDSGVRLGLSQELVAAVVRLVRGSEGVAVSLAWSPQAGAPAGFGNRRLVVEFSPGDLPALEEAADRLQRSEPSRPVDLVGAVVRLKRAVPGAPGTIRLRVLRGTEVEEVRVRLDDADYRVAVEAHLTGRPVRVRGRLERKAGFRRLAGPSDLRVVDLEEGERERLLKSLREPDDAP